MLLLDDVSVTLKFTDAPIGDLDSLELIIADVPVVAASDDENDGEDVDHAAPSAYPSRTMVMPTTARIPMAAGDCGHTVSLVFRPCSS